MAVSNALLLTQSFSGLWIQATVGLQYRWLASNEDKYSKLTPCSDIVVFVLYIAKTWGAMSTDLGIKWESPTQLYESSDPGYWKDENNTNGNGKESSNSKRDFFKLSLNDC